METNISAEHSHSIHKNGKKHIWYVKRLWELSKNLPVFEFDISSFNGFKEDLWFGDSVVPTVDKVLEHHQKIQSANFEHPIIIGEDGSIMDGVHRICKARLEGRSKIAAVRFDVNPEPDKIIST